MSASSPFRVQGERAAISVRLRQLETSDGALADGDLVYAARLNGKGVSYVQHPRSAGVEDFMLLDAPLPLTQGGPSLDYDVTLESGVAGLRVVDGVVEFLDADGGPVLRMSRPMLEGSDGKITLASVAVQGCAYDADPRAPWGRAPKPPGATMCTMHVSWDDATITYPALFDPAWVATGAMVGSTRRYHGASVLTDGRVLVSGGTTGSNTFAIYPTSELYNPATRTWAATGSFPSSTKLAFHTSSRLPSGKVAAVGGVDGSGIVLASLFLYDPAVGTWSTGPSMGNTHSSHTTTTLADGRLAVVGGYGAGTTPTNRVDLYNPTTNAWTVATSLPTARARHAAEILFDGRVLVAGGFDGTNYLSTATIYNPATNTWAATSNAMSAARADLTLSALTAGLVLAAGGTNSGGALASAQLFNPNNGWFTAAAPMAAARGNHRATRIGHDEVLVTGGNGGAGSLATVERYDAEDNVWAAEPSLPAAKEGHAAPSLGPSHVLVAGAGSAQTWGRPTQLADAAAGPVLGATWTATAGTRAAADLLSFKVVNHTTGTKNYTVKVVARGLDEREATRTIGTFSVGTTPNNHTMPVGNLPIQSVGVPSYAQIRIEFTRPDGTSVVTSEPLHYEFAAGYASATFTGATPKKVPAASLQSMFGISNGAIPITNATFLTQWAAATAPLASLVGRVFNGTDYQDVTTLPPKGGAAPIKSSYPVDGFFANVYGKLWPNLPSTFDVGPTFQICTYFNAQYEDAGYGEDTFAVRGAVQAAPASYARYAITRSSSVIAKGNLNGQGCVSLQLMNNQDYVFALEPRMFRAGGRSVDVRYRPAAPYNGVYINATTGLPWGAGIVNDELVLAIAFRTNQPAGGPILLGAAYEDQATRTAATVARAISLDDIGMEPLAFTVLADSVCPNSGPTPPSACANDNRKLYLGPFQIVGTDGVTKTDTHNTRWKFIVGHEFGHTIQENSTGYPRADAYSGQLTPPPVGLCGCGHVRNPEDKAHCLSSKESSNRAQMEGFAHFMATKVFNDLTQADCSFVYYKPSWDKPGAVVTDPPIARTCIDQTVRWLDNKCAGEATKGVEWDWLNFYTTVNRGTNATTMANLAAIYRLTCSGSQTGAPCDGHNVAFSALVTAANTVYGNALDPRANQFTTYGNSSGVNH